MGNEIVWKAMYMRTPRDKPIKTQLIYRTREEARGTVSKSVLKSLEWEDKENESAYRGEYWKFVIKKKEIQEVDME